MDENICPKGLDNHFWESGKWAGEYSLGIRMELEERGRNLPVTVLRQLFSLPRKPQLPQEPPHLSTRLLKPARSCPDSA